MTNTIELSPLSQEVLLQKLLEDHFSIFGEYVEKLSGGVVKSGEELLLVPKLDNYYIERATSELELLTSIPELEGLEGVKLLAKAKCILPSFETLLSAIIRMMIEAEKTHHPLLFPFNGCTFAALCVQDNELWVLTAHKYNNSWEVRCGPFELDYIWGKPLQFFPITKRE